MKRTAVGLVLLLAGLVVAQEAPALHVAQGIVEKVEKESLTVQPRLEGGKFGKPIMLKVTGTSKITTVSTRDAGKVIVQRDTDLKDLRAKQSVAVTYTTTKDGNVLLSAVAQTTEK